MKTIKVSIETVDGSGKVELLAQEWKLATKLPARRAIHKIAADALLALITPGPNENRRPN